MDDDLVSSALLGRLVRRRWPLLLLLAVLGALLGAAGSLVLSPGYESTSKVLAQGERDDKQMISETEVATSLIVLDRVATTLGSAQTGLDLKNEVSASILNGNVVGIRATGSTPERAQQLCDLVTTEYIGFSTKVHQDAADAADKLSARSRDAVQQRIDDANQKITALQGAPPADPQAAATQLDQLRQTVAEDTRQLDDIAAQAQSAQLNSSLDQSSISVIEPATRPVGAASPTLPQLIGAGAVALVLIGLFAHLVALRADRRLRRAGDVAAVLGAPVLGVVEVTDPRPLPSLLGRVGAIFRDERMWALQATPAPGDGADGHLFYRRVLARLHRHGVGPAHLLIVVPEGDPVARGAAALLALAAVEERPGLSLVVDGDELTAAVADAAADELRPRLTSGADAAAAAREPWLWIAEVAPSRAVLPDGVSGSVAVLVLTVGTLTDWQLAAITDACANAGPQPVGAVLAVPVRPRRPTKTAPNDDGPAGIDGGGPDGQRSDDATAVPA